MGRLALHDEVYPYIIPLNFLYRDRKIIFHCAFEGKKLDLISKNGNCCFEVDEYMGEVTYHYESRCHLDYDSVLAFGKARIEENNEEKIHLLQLFAEKYDERYSKEGGKKFQDPDSCSCVVIEIDKLTGRKERTIKGEREKTTWEYKFK